jgi:hypothetical protein
MIVNNFAVKQMLHCAPKVQIIRSPPKKWRESKTGHWPNLLKRYVIMIMMMMKKMNNHT